MGEHHDPWLVALIGGIASCIAGLIDYVFLSLLMRHKRIQQIQQKKWYLTYARFFQKIAFVTLVVTAFTPIPFDPAKFLAITSRYDKRKYALAIFVGRTPRYFVLAKAGSTGNVPINILIWAFVFLFAASIWKNRVIIKENVVVVYRRCSAKLKNMKR